MTQRSGFRAGLAASSPIVFGYVPACLTFGAVGAGIGVDPWTVMGLSAFLYAGASQFVAVKLLASGAAVPVILAAIALINLRYGLLAGSFATRLQGGSRTTRALSAVALTEEVYAVALYGARAPRPGPSVPYMVGLELPPYLATLLFTGMGILLAGLVPAGALPALNTSLYALLIALVLPQILRDRVVAITCLTAASASAVASTAFGSSGAMVIAAAAATAIGLVLLRRHNGSPGSAHDLSPDGETSR